MKNPASGVEIAEKVAISDSEASSSDSAITVRRNFLESWIFEDFEDVINPW